MDAAINYDHKDDVELDDTQQEAIDRCVDLTQRVVPVTGAAGTGKTTILKNVYHQLYKRVSVTN